MPITVFAAFAQTLRNAAQRHLIKDLGTIGATSVRFIYGLPFAVIWFALVKNYFDLPIPDLPLAFWLWVTFAAVGQIAGTALLLRVMAERNFAIGVAYSKTEVVQVALIAVFLLGDHLSVLASIAIILSALGVILISSSSGIGSLRDLVKSWQSKTALLGIASGAGFACASVGFRGTTQVLHESNFLMAAAVTLVVSQLLQSVLMMLWLAWNDAPVLKKIASFWRESLLAGFMGAAASAGWFSAMAIEPVAHVRTLGLVELFFTLVISRRVFREQLRAIEWCGMGLLAVGLVMITLMRH